LSTKLPANVKCALFRCQVFIPWSEIKNRTIELSERSPHQPPAFIGSSKKAAIRPGATVKRFHFGSEVRLDDYFTVGRVFSKAQEFPAEWGSFVDQVFLTKLLKLGQVGLPVCGNAPGVFPIVDSVVDSLIDQ
jgi:hypothetical protein